jgi:hypothetical protein
VAELDRITSNPSTTSRCHRRTRRFFARPDERVYRLAVQGSEPLSGTGSGHSSVRTVDSGFLPHGNDSDTAGSAAALTAFFQLCVHACHLARLCGRGRRLSGGRGSGGERFEPSPGPESPTSPVGEVSKYRMACAVPLTGSPVRRNGNLRVALARLQSIGLETKTKT